MKENNNFINGLMNKIEIKNNILSCRNIETKAEDSFEELEEDDDTKNENKEILGHFQNILINEINNYEQK